jgi:hypothetical protein
MPGIDRLDVEERRHALVAVDEASWQLASDDAAENAVVHPNLVVYLGFVTLGARAWRP